MLDHAEYVEQAYLFDLLRQRIEQQVPLQELLEQLRYELLTTTKLPVAVEYLLTELRHSGTMTPAMQNLGHYFTPFQAFLIEEAECETGRFAMATALQILHADAKTRADHLARLEDPQSSHEDMQQRGRCGLFFFQFETLCRNRLGYEHGLSAMSRDPIYDARWSSWLIGLRTQVGLVDLADWIFLCSDEYVRRMKVANQTPSEQRPILFGEKEGRIAFANRHKDPIYLFGAMQRHLGYPSVPRPITMQEDRESIPQLLRRMERLESRLKLMEQEAKSSIDLTKFYVKPNEE